MDTRTIVSDRRRKALKTSEGAYDQDRKVGTYALYVSLSDYLTLHRLTPGQQPRLEVELVSNIRV